MNMSVTNSTPAETASMSAGPHLTDSPPPLNRRDSTTGLVSRSCPVGAPSPSAINDNSADDEAPSTIISRFHARQEKEKCESIHNLLNNVLGTLDSLRKQVHKHVEYDCPEFDAKMRKLQEFTDDITGRCERKDRTEPAKKLGPEYTLPEAEIVWVDTTRAVAELVDRVNGANVGSDDEPLLYLDCEGVDLGRNGSFTLLTAYCPPEKTVFLIDLKTLGREAFKTRGRKHAKNLRHMLEDESIKKAFWDCRGDSDALYAHYEVHLVGVVDVQLLDIASRLPKHAKNLQSLSTCATSRLNVNGTVRDNVNFVDAMGKLSMREGAEAAGKFREVQLAIKAGREYTLDTENVFNRVEQGLAISGLEERPMPYFLVEYCVQDVLLLPGIHDHCIKHAMHQTAEAIGKETVERLRLSRSPEWQRGDMRAPPAGWGPAPKVKGELAKRR